MRWRSAWLTGCSAAILAGCGGGSEAPPLERLAARADAVAAAPSCEAAAGLRDAAIAAVNAGDVPADSQEELLAAANELAAPPCAGPAAARRARELAARLRG
jgi:hypothetical protein